jgi:nucleoside-diphosphate-sugar epimerase
MNGLINVLEVARKRDAKVFWPSSIAVFGNNCPRQNTPQDTVLQPTTMYGVTKVAGELLCDYYHRKYGLDVRSVRYAGIISAETLPAEDHRQSRGHFLRGGAHHDTACFVKEGRSAHEYMPTA